MFEGIMKFFSKMGKKEEKTPNSRIAAKERLHLVLMQDRANVSADFLELMKQEIIDVIKKYIEVDENDIDVRLTNKENEDGTNGAPALYANIPILNIKNDTKKIEKLEKEKSKEEIKHKDELKTNDNENKQEEKNGKDEQEEKKEIPENDVEEVNEKKDKETSNQEQEKTDEENSKIEEKDDKTTKKSQIKKKTSKTKNKD